MTKTDPSTIDWAQIDWVNLNDAAVSQLHGVHPYYVRRARACLGAPRAKTFHHHRNGLKAEATLTERRKWDWSQKDIDLAKVHNLSRERIRQIRKAIGLPSSRLSHQRYASKPQLAV